MLTFPERKGYALPLRTTWGKAPAPVRRQKGGRGSPGKDFIVFSVGKVRKSRASSVVLESLNNSRRV